MRGILILSLSLFLFSCGKTLNTEKELYSWISNEKHGLVQKKDIGNMIFTVKYLPADYLIYNDLRRAAAVKQATVDSLKNVYKGSHTFLMTIDFKNGSSGENVLMYGLESYGQYKERIEQLNFKLDDYIYLEDIAETETLPLLWTLENTYTVGNKRSIYMVFPKTGDQKEKLDLVFNDEIFHTGVNRFKFDSNDFASIPELNFRNVLKYEN